MRVMPALVSALLASTIYSQGPTVGWQLPSKAIVDACDAPPPPSVGMSPKRGYLTLTTGEAFAGIDVVARPHLKLAGMRIDPATYGPQLGARTLAIELLPLDGGPRVALRIPPGHWSGPIWSADDRNFALLRTTDDAIEVWLGGPDRAPKRVDGLRINGTMGGGVQWLPDQRRLLAFARTEQSPPPAPAAPSGPRIEAAERGVKKPVRTFQDLLTNAHDEALLEHYATSRLVVVDAERGTLSEIGAAAMYDRVEPSPDGEFLLVTTMRRPFSFRHTIGSFPRTTDVRRIGGETIEVLVERELEDSVPIGGVPTGRRGIGWVSALPHTLRWVEALDGGDPRRDVAKRDAVYLAEPGAKPRAWLETEHRAGGLQVAADGRTALAGEFDRKTRRERTWLVDVGDLAAPPKLFEERSTQDVYGDPGRPLTERLPNGESVLMVRDGFFYTAGAGAGPDGERPFLAKRSLQGGALQKVFEAQAGRYEQFMAFLDDRQETILIRSESPTEAASMVAVTLATGERRTLLSLADPAAEWTRNLEKRLIKYTREDGVPLSGTLYLPPGRKEGEKVPALVWAYPLEYTSASDAGQVRAAPTRAIRPRGASHLYLLLAGYAVFDDAAMPIVGPQRSANDTFVKQVQQNAAAAVAALAATGVIDTKRIAVSGHSYGAFMTANLLAHTDLFATGIARSGAYNRTLTPFGFQNEERTFWEARDVYLTMSPFSYADKIQEPLLLIHGEDDNNSGTFPIQSERLFAAIQGHGGEVRLCMLPHESHGYRARESVLHCLYEMCSWLDRHCSTAADRR